MAASKPESVRVSAAKCQVCNKPVVARYRPFCSRRCADVDLGRWFGGGYRMATEELPDPDELVAAMIAAEDGDDKL